MADYKETHVIKSDSGEKSGATPWLAFLVGVLLIAIVAVFLLNAHGTYSGPAGTINLNVKSPVQTPVNTR